VAVPVGQIDVAPSPNAGVEILWRWLDRLADGWGLVALAGAALAVGWVAGWPQSDAGERRARGWTAAAAAVGLAGVALRASLVDDAFISFHYAAQWARGHGPVFNVGETVQGYTNFLWMAVLAASTWITGVEPALVALVLGPIGYLAQITAVYALSRRLGSGPPLAAVWFALCALVTDYATTGLESGWTSLFVTVGCWAILGEVGPRGAALGGAAFTAASLCRLDHGLFQAVALGLIAVRSRDIRTIVAFLAPAALIGVYAGWAFWFYGEVLPNTAHAKASGAWAVAQAGLYLELFALGTWAWAWAIPAFGWAAWAVVRERGARRAFAGWVLVAGPLWQLYLARIGGDFMFGRFYLTWVPLLLVAAEQGVRAAPGRWSWVAAAAIGLGLRGLPMLGDRTEWYVTDEPRFYPVRSVAPLDVDHHSFRIGQALGHALTARGIRPVVATSGPGMVAYGSRLETIDLLGLTDRAVARGPSIPGGRPGHQKAASPDYLRARGVRFGHVYPPEPWWAVTMLTLGSWPGGRDDWFILTYDVPLMRRIAAEAPEIGFVDFEAWLDRYVARRMSRRTAAQVRDDLGFFDAYFFSINGPMRWREPIARAAAASGPAGGNPP